jgi:hypothetical protein
MQDDQLGPKIMVIAPAHMARLPLPELQKEIFLVVNNIVCQLGLHPL